MTTLEAGKRIALKNILFATDFSPYSNAALPYALAITRNCGAKLFGAHVLPSEEYVFAAADAWQDYPKQERAMRQRAEGRLEEQIQTVPHEILCAVGDIWEVLSRMISEHEIDLIVVGTHGRTGARKLFMGSVDEKIFRQASCPVLSVGPNVPFKPNREIQFQQILLATDFGEESLAALPYAVSLADEDYTQLALLHVISQPAAGVPDPDKVKRSMLSRLRDLAPLDAQPWCHVEYLVDFNDQFAPPGERILEIANERATDLIVIGARPMHGTVGTVTHFARSTAQYIVSRAACPVLTVRA